MSTKSKSSSVPAKVDESTNLPAVYDFGEDAGGSLSDIDRSEVGIPFIKVLQAQSPEVIGPNGQIDGAKAGQLLNTGTMELADSILFVPAIRQHVFVEWKPRNKGGGMVRMYEPNDPVVQAIVDSQEFGKYTTEAGNDLVETFYVFGVVLNPETREPENMAVVAFSSTGIKKYRKQFMQRIYYCTVPGPGGRKIKPPMFAHCVRISTENESNDQGTWKNFNIQFAVDNNVRASLLAQDDMAYEAAKTLAAAVGSGQAHADYEKADRGDAGDDVDTSAF